MTTALLATKSRAVKVNVVVIHKLDVCCQCARSIMILSVQYYLFSGNLPKTSESLTAYNSLRIGLTWKKTFAILRRISDNAC